MKAGRVQGQAMAACGFQDTPRTSPLKNLVTLLGYAILLGGCASAEVAATDESMLADAKARSARYCGSFPQGCEYKVSPGADGWSVWIKPIILAPDGRRAYAFDIDNMYFYDQWGEFKSALRGY